MNIGRHIAGALAIPAGALAGNWLGACLHRITTGRPAHGIVYRHDSLAGRKVQSIPMSTTFYPALLCATLGRPRWAFSFLGGLVISLVLGDMLEDRLMAWAVGRMPRSAEGVETPTTGQGGG